jgi:hypothetical protein
MLLWFLGLTSFLGFSINLEHDLHEGHLLFFPKLYVELLSIQGLA